MVDKLVRDCGVGMDQIAVLSPYRAQCHVIRENLTDRELSGVPVISIVKSQGRACCFETKTVNPPQGHVRRANKPNKKRTKQSKLSTTSLLFCNPIRIGNCFIHDDRKSRILVIKFIAHQYSLPKYIIS